MKLNTIFFCIAFLAITFFPSCSDDDSLNNEVTLSPPDNTVVDAANETFARILAKSLVDEEVRTFVREKSLLQVDKDYDVIYHLIKNEKLTSGISFREKLAEYCEGISLLDSITQCDPTLTILVPYIDSTMNAENWDVSDSYTPVVVLRKTDISMKETKLPFYDANENTGIIERFGKPKEYVLIVKSNERLISSDGVSTRSAVSRGNELENEEGLFAYFSDHEFNNYRSGVATRSVTSDLKARIERQQNSFYSYFRGLDSHRDYVYYGIDPKVNNTGALDNSYAEYLTEIKFNSSTSYNIVVKSSDISEGALEFYVDLIFNRENGVAFNMRKVLHVRLDEVFHKGIGIGEPPIYSLPQPLELFTWDFFEYGDTYKVSISEYDNGKETTTNHSISSTFGTNKEGSPGLELGPIKIGGKFGKSKSETVTSTTTTKLTENSVPLGDIFINFFDPIYLELGLKYRKLGDMRTKKFKPDMDGEESFKKEISVSATKYSSISGVVKTYNTGTMAVTIIPMRKK